jgi:hypothetical protein
MTIIGIVIPTCQVFSVGVWAQINAGISRPPVLTLIGLRHFSALLCIFDIGFDLRLIGDTERF